MCDETTQYDANEYSRRADNLSRRRFGSLTVGAGLMVMLPRLADAADVTERNVDIETPDGVADAYFVHPVRGAHAGVLIWPDAFGLRPALRMMGKRLAESGYSVLVVNPFYRQRRAPVVASANFSDPAVREVLTPLMSALNPQTHVTDAKAFVGFLDAQASVDTKRKIGTMGYCMGGPITMRTAAALPDRIGAGASFHGGGLVTDQPDSPHLLVPKMKAQYLIAIADNDDKRQPAEKGTLRAAFDQAGLKAEIEVYAGAMHGWCPPDTSAYDEKQAEKAWSRLLAVFGESLA